MKTYKLKDGRTVKAVKDYEELRTTKGCRKCALDLDKDCSKTQGLNNLPDCMENNIHFEIVEDEK
jgi:hypothetical protein